MEEKHWFIVVGRKSLRNSVKFNLSYSCIFMCRPAFSTDQELYGSFFKRFSAKHNIELNARFPRSSHENKMVQKSSSTFNKALNEID